MPSLRAYGLSISGWWWTTGPALFEIVRSLRHRDIRGGSLSVLSALAIGQFVELYRNHKRFNEELDRVSSLLENYSHAELVRHSVEDYLPEWQDDPELAVPILVGDIGRPDSFTTRGLLAGTTRLNNVLRKNVEIWELRITPGLGVKYPPHLGVISASPAAVIVLPDPPPHLSRRKSSLIRFKLLHELAHHTLSANSPLEHSRRAAGSYEVTRIWTAAALLPRFLWLAPLWLAAEMAIKRMRSDNSERVLPQAGVHAEVNADNIAVSWLARQGRMDELRRLDQVAETLIKSRNHVAGLGGAVTSSEAAQIQVNHLRHNIAAALSGQHHTISNTEYVPIVPEGGATAATLTTLLALLSPPVSRVERIVHITSAAILLAKYIMMQVEYHSRMRQLGLSSVYSPILRAADDSGPSTFPDLEA